MRCPEIISFHNGVIEWSADSGAAAFIVVVNGKTVSDGDDGFYRGTTYALDMNVDAVITVAYADDETARISLVYDSATKKLALAPITEYSLNGDWLEWNEAGGAAGYRVYDVDFNVTTVDDAYYYLHTRKPVWCVCPVPVSSAVCESEPRNVDIKYLDGDGTETAPYLIHTPVELRAIDYYETKYALCDGERNHYKIARDIDYLAVGVLEGESNICTLKKPFFGVLDGDGKRLSHIHVRYDGGYWALFDYIALGGRVQNITFDDADIYNSVRDEIHPINSSTAVVAFVNNGEIVGVALDGVRITAVGGGVCGIAVHNNGSVCGCRVNGEFVQYVTSGLGSASYEMSCIVLENRAGGVVRSNIVTDAMLRGTGENIRAAAGCVSVNRAGGIVEGNSFGNITVGGRAIGTECGGIVAYNSGCVVHGVARLGTLVVDGSYVECDFGGGDCLCGRLIGKNDGEVR